MTISKLTWGTKWETSYKWLWWPSSSRIEKSHHKSLAVQLYKSHRSPASLYIYQQKKSMFRFLRSSLMMDGMRHHSVIDVIKFMPIRCWQFQPSRWWTIGCRWWQLLSFPLRCTSMARPLSGTDQWRISRIRINQ